MTVTYTRESEYIGYFLCRISFRDGSTITVDICCRRVNDPVQVKEAKKRVSDWVSLILFDDFKQDNIINLHYNYDPNNT